MKTPRFALLALLVLSLAPIAKATDFPTWAIIEEGSRSWPQVRFTVGQDRRILQCRYKECNPETNKGLSNLYLLNKTGESTPTNVTIYRPVRRSKANPRYWTDGPDDMVPEIIKAQANSYTAELSHFKLDNTGGKLTVFQGTTRYPASTDIDEAQHNNYDQMKVAPPKKLVDDEVTPVAPPAQRSTWWCNQSTGEIIVVHPGHKPPEGYNRLESRSSTCGKKTTVPAHTGPRTLSKLPTAGKWKDAITPVGEWRAIQTSAWPILGLPIPVPALVFYCYHEKMDGDKDLTSHLKKNPLIVECVNWTATADDATKEAGGKKYKVRNNSAQFDLAYRNGRLETLSGVSGLIVTEQTALPDALGGEKFVKVTNPTVAPAIAGVLPLSDKEVKWLDKRQANEYATDKAAAEAKPAAEKAAAIAALGKKYRDFVVENLQPNKTVSDAYKAAAGDSKATQESIDKSLSIEVWGGADNKTIVELFGTREDIQLSKADFDELAAKHAEPKTKYVDDRTRADGREAPKATVYDAKYYDPIVLHRTAEAARKILGRVPGVTPPVVAPVRTILTKEEIALLTPEEKKIYDSLLRSATVNGKLNEQDENLLKYAEALRKKILDEKRGAAATPPPSDEMTLEKFNAMDLFQKRKFCVDYPVDVATIAGDRRAGELDTQANALTGARLTAANPLTRPAGTPPPQDTKWPKKERQDACRKLPPESAAQIDPAGALPANGIGNLVNGPDVDGKPKPKPTVWASIPLAQTAFAGALTGLLIGSLFGPVGLIAGPLLGAALYYGLKVHAAKKAAAGGDE